MVENKADEIPLEELSINDLFIGGDARTYEIPIYQRNYAWEEEQVKALITDVTDAYTKNPDSYYYIGTLVSYNKGDQIFEIIDGQQRLTTIRLILGVLISEGHLKGEITNKLTYRARKKSDYTLKGIPSKSDINTEKQKSSDSREPCRSSIFQKYDDKKLIDFGILNGFKFAENNIRNLDILENDFVNYFLHKVHIIHYKVPRDIDLNHYFEVMNSRGEQLEKHEIVKAQLINKIGDIKDSDDLKKKNRILLTKIWEACSNMGKYVQQNLNKNDDCNFVFGDKFDTFNYKSFQEIADKFYNNFDRKIEELKKNNKTESSSAGCAEISLDKIIELKPSIDEFDKEGENTDSFQPIIDFPNFLLIVLKITLMQIRLPENNFDYCGFPLDDKELLSAFKDQIIDSSDVVKKFIFNLLKARFLLDNYVVHHVFEEDTEESNPWKIQIYTKEESSSDNSNNKYSYSYKNSFCNSKHQEQLVQLLSMFEVTYSQKQRKNYLFYCLYYLMNSFDTARSYYDSEQDNDNTYAEFVEKLADKFFFDVYLGDNLIEKDKNDQSEEVYLHNPKAGAFNSVIKIDEFINNRFNCQKKHTDVDFFFKIYGDGIKRASEGIPLYIFNYLDYKLWKLYVTDVRGREANKKEFFETRLGCPDDISLDVFNRFYFSRTRKSLEHFYPQAGATGDNDSTNEIAIDDKGPLNQTQINCIGNFAMIGSEANSSGSNWTPKTKLDHYLDDSSKIKFISVASLKFMIMMHICKKSNKEDNYKWGYNEIQDHQKKMLALLGLTGNDAN